jgi:curved DNA-binding protein CbpA
MNSNQSPSRDYYDILGADEAASPRDLEKLYKRMAARCHPDRGGSEEAMKLVNEAYDVLKNGITRREYDAKRRLSRYVAAVPRRTRPPEDIGAFGGFLSAFLCLLMGMFLLFLVRVQWIWFLWPLVILALFVIVFGILLARGAVMQQASNAKRNPFRSHRRLQEAIFWTAVLSSCYAIYMLLAAIE